MVVVGVDDFIAGLRDSGLMNAAEVEAFLISFPQSLHPLTVQVLAAELVRRGRLTKYQTARIATGRPRGLVLGNYTIVDKVGEGGMGEVLLAEHRRMKRPVVVKVLPASAMSSPDAIRRFQREVEAAAQLSHPNIVTAFDADEAGGVHFLVLEYVRGEPLSVIVTRDGPLPIGKAVDVTLQAARGLAYAHSRGIIHRDIKPSNLLLDVEGVVKILDMGLARFDAEHAASTYHDDELTRENQIVGTVEYMSPEQVDDSSHADGRSDIYSLGCALFRLLTNRPPYVGESPVKTLIAHRVEPIPDLRHFRSDAPESLNDIFHRMVAKLPANRHPHMEAVVVDLERFLAGLEPRPVALTGRGGRPDSQSTTTSLALTTEMPKPTELPLPDESIAMPAMLPGKEVVGPAPGDAPHRGPTSIPATLAERAIGIDLGTTFSAIAVLDAAGTPQVLVNDEGDKTTPSVVLVDERDVVIVGKEAVKAMSSQMDRIAECAKRELGRPAFHRPLANEQVPPEVLQAWVLKKLRQDAQRRIGLFTKAVVTVPAYFDEVRRKATMDAGFIAGLEVLDIINEPTAAALAFGFQHGRLQASADGDAQRILVYDLGGGTFDVTIMEIATGEFITLATDGDVRLGGRDWDQRLVDLAAEAFVREFGADPREDPNAYGKLLRECEDAKRSLSTRKSATITSDYQGRAMRVKVSREQFEELTADLLDRTVFTTRQTLTAAKLDWDDIDHVLLVGGSTRMPAVVRTLRQLSGREPDTSVSPDEAVAMGAAIHAGFLLDQLAGQTPKARVHNVNSHSLGVVATDRKTNRRRTAVLIPRNTPLPARASRVFRTLKDNQQSIIADIVEGESNDPEACMPIGRCTVRDLPPLPAGTPIEVRFSYAANGRLNVLVNIVGVRENVAQEISRVNNLSQRQLEQWRRRLEE